MLDERLLEILACPSCGGDVNQQGEQIICTECGLKYPIRNGVPVLLVDQAKK